MNQIEMNIEELTKALTKNHLKWANQTGYKNVPEKEILVKEGNKYYKMVVGSSVHAFIDKKTGDIYKPAGFNTPAKGIRYNILKDFEKVITVCDWYGSWLYR